MAATLALGGTILALVTPAIHPGVFASVAGASTITQLASGTSHTCALYSGGEVKWCAPARPCEMTPLRVHATRGAERADPRPRAHLLCARDAQLWQRQRRPPRVRGHRGER